MIGSLISRPDSQVGGHNGDPREMYPTNGKSATQPKAVRNVVLKSHRFQLLIEVGCDTNITYLLYRYRICNSKNESNKQKFILPGQLQIGQKLASNCAHAPGQFGSKYGQTPFHVVVAAVVVVTGLLPDVNFVGGVSPAGVVVSCVGGVKPAGVVFLVVDKLRVALVVNVAFVV